MRIAITGGIGSGKSTVTKIITEQGYPTFSCDIIYKQLLKEKSLTDKLVTEFGDSILTNGLVDKKNKLSKLVFNDPSKLKRLNEITHPMIIEEAFKQMFEYKVAFCEVPLLFEGGFESLFDNVIVVLRNKSIRISTVMERDNLTEVEVMKRIDNQFDYDGKDFSNYYVIYNNSNLENLNKETLNILDQLIK